MCVAEAAEAAARGVDELAVVTLVVAARGNWSLPPIRTVADLRAALKVGVDEE